LIVISIIIQSLFEIRQKPIHKQTYTKTHTRMHKTQP